MYECMYVCNVYISHPNHNASTREANEHERGTLESRSFVSDLEALEPRPSSLDGFSCSKEHTLSNATVELCSEKVPWRIICICLLFSRSDSMRNSTASDISCLWLMAHSSRTCSPSSRSNRRRSSGFGVVRDPLSLGMITDIVNHQGHLASHLLHRTLSPEP